MNTLVKGAAAALLSCAVACSDSNPIGPNGSDGTMTATVDGTSWSGSLVVSASLASGLLSVAGQNSGTTPTQIQLRVVNVSSTGTFQLGPGNAHFAQVSVGTQAWSTSLVGGSGTITLTTLTGTRAAGSFSFTAVATPGSGSTGTKSVTSGSFDVELGGFQL